jgi:hypothetical protein
MYVALVCKSANYDQSESKDGCLLQELQGIVVIGAQGHL